jgi:hypothetical protein
MRLIAAIKWHCLAVATLGLMSSVIFHAWLAPNHIASWLMLMSFCG